MKIYIIYFTIFGKHLKTAVKANSEKDAQQFIRNNIVFHNSKTEIREDPVEYLKNMFGL